MRSSIRIKLAMMFVMFTAGAIIVLYTINVFFLEAFYRYTKERNLTEIYDTISGGYEEQNENFLVRLCQASGISLLITDEAGDELFNYGTSDVLSNRLQDMIFGIQDENSKIMEANEQYTLQNSQDYENNLEYIEMWGMISGNDYFIMQMSHETLKESATISSRFFAYMGIMVISISFYFMFVASKSFARPIMELAYISKRMTNLDFDVKYTEERNDEIGVLGDCMNEMSDKLETTIKDLKSANITLEKDLETRTKADEMRKEFLSNVSHELKTPLALISGYAEGLKESVNSDEESKEFYCDVIIDEATKMNTIVKKLLTLNQIEFGNDQINIERFDIVELVKGVIDSSSILLKNKNLNVIFNNDEQICVWADIFQTEQILVNYLTNAINHVDDKRIINVSIEQINTNARIKVYNSGKHIPEDEIDKIWQKFYKVDKARTREYGGSGIGLSIVKAIAESFNKEYGARNVDGGVEFWFELDLVADNCNK